LFQLPQVLSDVRASHRGQDNGVPESSLNWPPLAELDAQSNFLSRTVRRGNKLPLWAAGGGVFASAPDQAG